MSSLRTLCCEEWGKVPFGTTDGVSERELEDLLRAWAVNAGGDPESFFDLRRRSIRPKNWSGVLSGSLIQLEVLPPSCGKLSPAERAIVDRNLSLMVATVVKGPIRSGSGDLSSDGSRFEALFDAFCAQLGTALRRRISRIYTTQMESSRTVKGKLVFPGQFFYSIMRPGFFLTESSGLTLDTPENRFIKFVLEWSAPQLSGGLKRRSEELLVHLEQANLPGDPWKERSRIRFDRLTDDYKAVLELGSALLTGKLPGFFSGITPGLSNILFTSRTFEAFIGLCVSQVAAVLGLSTARQLRGIYAGRWSKGPHADREVFECIPDILVREADGKRVRCVIDTKWKPLEPRRPTFGIDEGDVYQLSAYAARFNVDTVVLCYPYFGGVGSFSEEISFGIARRGSPLKFLLLLVDMLSEGFAGLDEQIAGLLSGG